jgi:phospholipid/cholesterol/gamma-HCH transport system substrate-binding protein
MFDLKKQLMWSKLKVGALITITLIILLITVFFSGGIEKLLSPTIEIKAGIKNVKGLRTGSPVWLSGIEIGAVKKIELHPELGTIVTMSVEKKSASFIKKDSTATVQTIGLLGDKYIEISAGSTNSLPVSRGDMIKGVEQIEIKDIVKAGAETITKITEFTEELEGFLKRLEKSMKEVTNSKFFTDSRLYNNLEETSRLLASLLTDLKESEGTIKKLINDPSLYDKMLSATSSLDDFSKKIQDSEGTLKMLVEDPSLYYNLDTVSKKLKDILKKIETGEGMAGSLLNDKELDNDFKNSITEIKSLTKEINELVKDIKSNPKKYFKFSIF